MIAMREKKIPSIYGHILFSTRVESAYIALYARTSKKEKSNLGMVKRDQLGRSGLKKDRTADEEMRYVDK